MDIFDRYLGDGLYVGFDGYQIRLYTERYTETGAHLTHEVFLESEVLVQFLDYIKTLPKEFMK